MIESEVRSVAAVLLARFPEGTLDVDRMAAALAADDADRIRAAVEAWEGDRIPTVAELRAHGRPEALDALPVAVAAEETEDEALPPSSGKIGEHWRRVGFEGIAAARAASEAVRNGSGPGRVVGSDT